MTTRKGMSQTLALIVAASVLMMTALTVIFLAQGSLSSFGEDSSNRACNSAVDTQIELMNNGDTSRIPNSCFTAEGEAVSGAPNFVATAAGNNQRCMQATSDSPSISEMDPADC